jgi:hypothetical protein
VPDLSDAYKKDVSAKILELERIARDLYDGSDDFPALNRNVKRILASVAMLRMNVEEWDDA